MSDVDDEEEVEVAPRVGAVWCNPARRERGIVVFVGQPGERGYPGSPIATRFVLKVSAGIEVHTDQLWLDGYRPVPRGEWTTVERVSSASLRWQRPSWDDPAEHDSFEFRLMQALLTDEEAERVFPERGDWPTTIDELALTVGRVLDDRHRGDRTLGSALARLGMPHA